MKLAHLNNKLISQLFPRLNLYKNCLLLAQVWTFIVTQEIISFSVAQDVNDGFEMTAISTSIFFFLIFSFQFHFHPVSIMYFV